MGRAGGHLYINPHDLYVPELVNPPNAENKKVSVAIRADRLKIAYKSWDEECKTVTKLYQSHFKILYSTISLSSQNVV